MDSDPQKLSVGCQSQVQRGGPSLSLLFQFPALTLSLEYILFIKDGEVNSIWSELNYRVMSQRWKFPHCVYPYREERIRNFNTREVPLILV